MFADTERLYRAITAVAENICNEYARGGMGTLVASMLVHIQHADFMRARQQFFAGSLSVS